MPWCKGTHCSHGQCDTQVQLIDGQIGWVTAFSTTGVIHGKGMNAHCSNIIVRKCESTTANLTCNYYAIGLCIKPNVFHKQHLFCCRHPCTLNVITKTDVLSMNLSVILKYESSRLWYEPRIISLLFPFILCSACPFNLLMYTAARHFQPFDSQLAENYFPGARSICQSCNDMTARLCGMMMHIDVESLLTL